MSHPSDRPVEHTNAQRIFIVVLKRKKTTQGKKELAKNFKNNILNTYYMPGASKHFACTNSFKPQPNFKVLLR